MKTKILTDFQVCISVPLRDISFDIWKFHFEQNFVNRGKLCFLGLTRVFRLENGKSVGTGKTCPNLQDSIKTVTAINNKLQENEINSKLKRRSAVLRDIPNVNTRK